MRTRSRARIGVELGVDKSRATMILTGSCGIKIYVCNYNCKCKCNCNTYPCISRNANLHADRLERQPTCMGTRARASVYLLDASTSRPSAKRASASFFSASPGGVGQR